jgi:hypothetical protein
MLMMRRSCPLVCCPVTLLAICECSNIRSNGMQRMNIRLAVGLYFASRAHTLAEVESRTAFLRSFNAQSLFERS